MNKQKGIIMGILALAVTMMVGYALFSETITINGTATAKGDFDMTVTCERGLPDIFSKTATYDGVFWGSISSYKYNDNNYKNDSCTVTGDTLTYDVELTQPDASRTFVAKITNQGSIDSILNVETGVSTDRKRCAGDIKTDTLGECTADYEGNNMHDFELLAFESSTGEVTSLLAGDVDAANKIVAEYFNTDPLEIILSPGESVYLRLVAWWDPYNGDSGFADGNSAYYKDTAKIDFKFTQATAN